MKNQLAIGIALLLVSTLCYYIPEYFASAANIDFTNVPDDFHNHYKFRTSGAFLLTAIYAGFLFFFTNSKHYKIKIIFLWLSLAETYTFLNHVSDEFFLIDQHDYQEIMVTCIIFIICFSWFLSRLMRAYKSDKFFPGRTYIIRFKPVNILGIFNHIFNLHGHVAIYQDRHIYKFKKASGRVEGSRISPHSMESMIENRRISIKEIPRNEKISDLVGRKYNLFKFNCNHLIKSAEKVWQK